MNHLVEVGRAAVEDLRQMVADATVLVPGGSGRSDQQVQAHPASVQEARAHRFCEHTHTVTLEVF